MEKLVVLTMFYGGKMQRMLDSSVTHLLTMETSGVWKFVHVFYIDVTTVCSVSAIGMWKHWQIDGIVSAVALGETYKLM